MRIMTMAAATAAVGLAAAAALYVGSSGKPRLASTPAAPAVAPTTRKSSSTPNCRIYSTKATGESHAVDHEIVPAAVKQSPKEGQYVDLHVEGDVRPDQVEKRLKWVIRVFDANRGVLAEHEGEYEPARNGGTHSADFVMPLPGLKSGLYNAWAYLIGDMPVVDRQGNPILEDYFVVKGHSPTAHQNFSILVP